MGKKGTKRKTKWRALPLAEDAGGSGNDEEIHEEDHSTTSSVAGHPTSTYNKPPIYYRMAEKGHRQTRRFPYDRFRSREPLVKLESKTFDEEEYTKITTPRQDVLFKKGCFGRKRESLAEESSSFAGEMDGEEPMMDQIIITNGFVDERGHYLVNGNSYEIYDPYSNTLTVVVGPPPYANGVSQPVLAAVSCQPVPLHPVDWYPPASDWPSQGSAWSPTFPRNPSSPGEPSTFFQASSAFVTPPFVHGDSSMYNGVVIEAFNNEPATEVLCSGENENETENNSKKTRRNSLDSKADNAECEKIDNSNETKTEIPRMPMEERMEVTEILEEKKESETSSSSVGLQRESLEEDKAVEKQSHSTQTNLWEESERLVRPQLEKESHSTQTPPEKTFPSNKIDLKIEKENEKIESNKRLSDILSSFTKEDAKVNLKTQTSRCKEHLKAQEETPRKIYQQRTNFSEERKVKIENAEKRDCSPVKMSYARKAMTGLEVTKDRCSRSTNGALQTVTKRLTNGTKNGHSPVINGMNGTGRGNGQRQSLSEKSALFDERKNTNGHLKNGYIKSRYIRNESVGKTHGQKDLTQGEKKFHMQNLETVPESVVEKKCKEIEETRGPSEKSSTVSELSSPAELSSGENTPPEKLIVKKIEQKIAREINKSFEEKLISNLTEKEDDHKKCAQLLTEEENKEKENKEERKMTTEVEEVSHTEKSKIKPGEGKKKKNKRKTEAEKPKETMKGNKAKKKKKKVEEESKDKPESHSGSSLDISFIPNFIQANPQDLLYGAWEGMKEDHGDIISEMKSILTDDEEILKSLGISEDKLGLSKLPLHSDLLMMLPAFGWSRPKLKIEDFFSPSHVNSDVFTKTHITNMKSTKPEEFFASVVDGPMIDRLEKKKEPSKNGKKEPGKMPEKLQENKNSFLNSKKTGPKTGQKPNKKNKSVEEEPKDDKKEMSNTEVKFGIVEAVNSWLQEQGDAEKVLSLDAVSLDSLVCLTKDEEKSENRKDNQQESIDQKNGESNPVCALSASTQEARTAEFKQDGGCIRVANVINDGFKHLDKEFDSRKKAQLKDRMYRSSSWDAKLSDVKIKKHFKFLTDSASFCQDLISDVRNGLPTRSEYATEELCDPKQSVSKYYTIAPGGRPKPLSDSDSDNEVFDALEYKFLTRENLTGREIEGKTPNGNGNEKAPIATDTGARSDVFGDRFKENGCKLQ